MLRILAKYLLEAIAIAVVAKLLIGRETSLKGLVVMTLSIVLTLVLLDRFAPGVAAGTRQGTGFGVGRQLIGGGGGRSNDDDEPNWTEVSEAVGGGHSTDMSGISVTMPHSVNLMERFMDDKMALKYYQGDWTPKHNPSLDERFTSVIRHQRSGVPMAFEGFESVPTTFTALPGMATPMTASSQQSLAQTPPPQTMPPTQVVGSTAAAGQPLFSGSLVNLIDNNGNQLVLDGGGGGVKLAKEGLGTGLFKLRFELVNGHDTNRQVPISHGVAVRLIYNDQSGQQRGISIVNGIVSTTDSGVSSGFSLMNSMNLQDSGQVMLNSEVILQQSGQFIQADPSTGRLSAVTAIASATKFKIISQRGCGPLWLFS